MKRAMPVLFLSLVVAVLTGGCVAIPVHSQAPPSVVYVPQPAVVYVPQPVYPPMVYYWPYPYYGYGQPAGFWFHFHFGGPGRRGY